MFTAKATAYFSLTVGLLTLALLLGDFRLGVLVLGMASLFFVSNIWGLPERVDIGLGRTVVPDETFGGETIRVESQVHNNTNSDLFNVEIDEFLEERIEPERGLNRALATISPGEESMFTFEFKSPPRSKYEIGPLTVRTKDPLGFYLKETRLHADELWVLPRPERLIGISLQPRHVGHWPGVIPTRSLGIGTDFYSIRDYVTGDDPKRINWKASAHHNSLIVNETEAERVTDIMIVLDANVPTMGLDAKDLFEREVDASASVASLLLRQGNRVGLILQGGTRGSVPAGFGKRHERKILYLLAYAKPGRASISTSYVVNLLAQRMLPSRAQIIIISPLLDPEMKEGIRELTISGYSMLIISPAPSLPTKTQDFTTQTAIRLVLLERSITLLGLEKFAHVVDWPPQTPLSAMLAKVKTARPQVLA